MAEKDISEKILEDHADVFADIVNGFCFQGREVVKPDELELMNLRSAYCMKQQTCQMYLSRLCLMSSSTFLKLPGFLTSR